MSLGLSLYLDLLRFGLAVLVWVGHSTSHVYTGHPFPLWFTYDYGRTAVMGFFVLSGFVIAHVSQGAESSPSLYAVARVSRLYSIVIPALLLT
jgi:peptidoglycan/LPS O-acetylase OafA/YrhL